MYSTKVTKTFEMTVHIALLQDIRRPKQTNEQKTQKSKTQIFIFYLLICKSCSLITALPLYVTINSLILSIIETFSIPVLMYLFSKIISISSCQDRDFSCEVEYSYLKTTQGSKCRLPSIRKKEILLKWKVLLFLIEPQNLPSYPLSSMLSLFPK